MAAALTSPPDRRVDARRRPQETPWEGEALLRPGVPVRVIDLSRGGVLVECASRLRPGTRAELQLIGPHGRYICGGRVQRCAVAQLDPLRYRGALVFDEPLLTCTHETSRG